MFDRLLSPNGRRIARTDTLGERGTTQLRQLGWTDYDGPAQATYSKHTPALSGWVVPRTDQNVDTLRRTRTGLLTLGTNTGTHDPTTHTDR